MNRSKQRHRLLVTLGLAFIMTVISAVVVLAEGNTEIAASTSKPNDTSPVTLTVYTDAKDTALFEWSQYWGKNPFTQKVTKDTGVTPQVSYNPDGTAKRLNLLIASNDLPDIIIGGSQSSVREMIDAKMIWDLTELSKKAAPDFMKKVPPNVLLNMRMTYDTMGFYGMPNFWARPEVVKQDGRSARGDSGCGGPTIIASVYDELGSPVIKTGDDYINLMKRALAKYPDMLIHSNRNIGRDSWGGPNLLQAYVLPLAGINKLSEKNGKIITFLDDPDFPKAVKFANRLLTENILFKDELTADGTARRANLAAGKVLAEISQDWDNLSPLSGWAMILQKDPRFAAKPYFVGLDMFQVVPGRDPVFATSAYAGGLSGVVMVSTKSAKADRAIRFVEYMMLNDDTQRDLIFGVEGVGWDKVDGKVVARKDVFERFMKDQIAAQQQLGIWYGIAFRNDEWMNRLTKQVWPFAPNMTEALAKFNRYAVDLEMYRYLQNYPTDSEEAKIFASITVYYGGKIGEIIAGPPQNVESAVKALVDQIRSMGLAKLDAFHTAAYGQYMAKVKKYTP